jgi:hypothetical protein
MVHRNTGQRHAHCIVRPAAVRDNRNYERAVYDMRTHVAKARDTLAGPQRVLLCCTDVLVCELIQALKRFRETVFVIRISNIRSCSPLWSHTPPL